MGWIEQDAPAHELALALTFLCSAYYHLAQYPQAKTAAERALAICQSQGDLSGIAINTEMLAYILIAQNQHDEGVRLIRQSHEIYKQLDDRLSMSGLSYRIGSYLDGLGDFNHAIQYLHEARDISSEMGWLDWLSSCLGWESMVILRMGDITRARELRRELLELARSIANPTDIIWGLVELAEVERVAGDLPLAESLLAQAVAQFQDAPMTMVMAFYHKCLGDISLAKDQTGAAREHFNESSRLARRDYNPWATAYAALGLARVALQEGDLVAARSFLREAAEAEQLISNRAIEMNELACWAAYFAAAGETARAVELCSLVIQHGATWQEVRQRVSDLLLRCARQLPADELAAAQSRGRGLALDATLPPSARPLSRLGLYSALRDINADERR